MSDLTHAEDSENYEKDNLEEMPIPVVGDLEQHQFPGSVGVHDLKPGLTQMHGILTPAINEQKVSQLPQGHRRSSSRVF